MTPQDTTILHLSLCNGIGPILIQRIRQLCADNIKQIYDWSAADWIHKLQVTSKRAEQLVTHLAAFAALHDELARIERAQAQWITIADAHYPTALRAIHAPPVVLYWFGSRDAFINAQALAIIGSRNANAYGARAIKAFVPPLVDVGFTIVSGGALGADSMAHRETINANGITVAVLGSGLSRLYPRTNVKLFEEIIAIGGAVVSSFPMTMESLPENFPARNRIIAGLSRGCIVVQAAAKSGTRITADYALQQGREVFVVPGCFDDPLSAGCHALAHDGATMVTSATDVLAELGITAAQQESVQSTVVTEQQAITSVQHELTIADKIIVATRMPATVDEVAAQLNLEYDVVQQQLWDLQWRGMVHQDFTGRWVHN